MKNKISITFGSSKGKRLFQVKIGIDKCFWINEDEAEKNLNYDLIKFILDPTDEEIKYIQEMYKKWYKECINV